MSDKAAIHIQNLGKKYKCYSNHWSRLAEWVSRGHFVAHKEHWALKGISFDVKGGDSIGIIGQNGAGKSTLLKILTGTTQPTEGSMMVEGRVAAILELGMGFHPDFTGRQNAVLSCRMAGLTSEEVQVCLPEIHIFSELGDYFDQPLRVYSTGMQMRLAFSCATVVRPDILIVDEALSVGDAYFQHKCIQRIRSFQNQGTTLLFVSHDPGAVKSICRSAILLDQGHLVVEGTPDSVLDYYNALIAKKTVDEEIRRVENNLDRIVTRSGTGEASIQSIDICNSQGRSSRAFRVGEYAKIHCRILFNARLKNITIGFLIRDRLGNDVFGTNTFHLCNETPEYEAGETIDVIFTLQLNLGVGHYSVTIAAHSRDTHLENNYDWWDQGVVFQIISGNSYTFVGLAALPVEVDIKRRHNND